MELAVQLLSTVVVKWFLFYLHAQELLNELKLNHKKEQNKLSERSVYYKTIVA